MDFSEAKFEAGTVATGAACATCGTALTAQYWLAGPVMVCASCAEKFRAGPPAEGGALRFFMALMFGTGAGLLGAIGYGVIIYATGYELALITIGIGWFVGRAVMKGSDNRGGRTYQVMAAALTYFWCMEAYVPSVVKELSNAQDPMPTAFVMLVAPFFAPAIPFFGGMGPLSLLILGFGVWRGWRETAKLEIPVTGPFELAQEPAALPDQQTAPPAVASAEPQPPPSTPSP
jgi:hypothetical protein